MRTKVKAILHILATSALPNAPRYNKLLHSPIKSSLRYALLIYTLLAFATVVLIYAFVVPAPKITAMRNGGMNAMMSLPKDARIRIENGMLSSNLNRPLFVWLPQQSGPPMLLLQVDENGEVADNRLMPLISLGKDHVSFRMRQFKANYPYDQRTYEITSKTLGVLRSRLQPLLPKIQTAFYVLLFTLFPVLLFVWLWSSVFIGSVVSYVIFHLFIKRVHFMRCFQASLHGSVIPAAIGLLLLVLYPNSLSALIVTPILILIFSLVSVFEMYFDE